MFNHVTTKVAKRIGAGRENAGWGGAETRLLSCSRYGAWRSLVSALVWGTRGPEFKSRRPDSKSGLERSPIVRRGLIPRRVIGPFFPSHIVTA